MTGVREFFFGIFPYICLTSFIVGHIWRYRYDQYGWTTRSSQWYETKTLRWASPAFHFGLLFVLLGHFVGLVIPESWTSALGISEQMYHYGALALGGLAAIVMLVGLLGLLWRRFTVAAVRQATTRMDKVMYLVLVIVIVLGLTNTFYFQTQGGGYNYRETVSVWFRSVFYLHPDAALMSSAPWSFQLHAIAALCLVAIWPYTRLVHVLSAPVWYMARPYIVYRSRAIRPDDGLAEPQRGWEKSKIPSGKH